MEIGFSTSLVFSLALMVIAAVWISKYGTARKARKYSKGRETIVRNERFTTFGQVIFVVSNLVTLVSFWTNSQALLPCCENHGLRVAGMVVLIAATLLHVTSMKHLGENYSPCFDSHRPFRLVKQGPYQYVRHPIYLANILLGAGYSLASCSLWVLAFSGYGAFKMVRALEEEESYLSKSLPGYEKYRAKTSRLIRSSTRQDEIRHIGGKAALLQIQMLKTSLKLLLGLIVFATIAFTVFWFACPADVSFDEVRASFPYSEYSRFAEIDGVRIHYQEKGVGTPLVLLHGFTSSTYSWKDVFEPLSRSFRVIALDLKGFGFSGKPDGYYTRRAQAQLVAGLCNHLKIEKAWLAGSSMGGEVALNVAIAHPQRVAGLILIGSGGVEVKGNSSLAPVYVRIPFVGRALTAFALTSDKLVRQGLEKSFFDDAKVTPDRVAHYYRPLRTRGGQLAGLTRTHAGGPVPHRTRLGQS